jgi:hypothetical protein
VDGKRDKAGESRRLVGLTAPSGQIRAGGSRAEAKGMSSARAGLASGVVGIDEKYVLVPKNDKPEEKMKR